MSPRKKTAATLGLGIFIGVLIGGVSVFLIMGRQMRWLMAFQAQVAMGEAAMDARQIAAGQSDAVLERKNAAIPYMVLTFEKEHAGYLPQDQRVGALWAVQRHYADNPSLNPPPEVKAILDALPPRPPTSCELNRAAASNPDHRQEDRPGAR